METASFSEIPRSPNPQIATEFFASFHHYRMVKSITFMTENLENFVLKTDFVEDIPPQLAPRKVFILLYFNFIKLDKVPPSVYASPIQTPNAPTIDIDFFNILTFNLINFDDVTPVYSKDPVFLTKLWAQDIYVRVKVQRPYEGADFRDITLTFMAKDAAAKETANG